MNNEENEAIGNEIKKDVIGIVAITKKSLYTISVHTSLAEPGDWEKEGKQLIRDATEIIAIAQKMKQSAQKLKD